MHTYMKSYQERRHEKHLFPFQQSCWNNEKWKEMKSELKTFAANVFNASVGKSENRQKSSFIWSRMVPKTRKWAEFEGEPKERKLTWEQHFNEKESSSRGGKSVDNVRIRWSASAEMLFYRCTTADIDVIAWNAENTLHDFSFSTRKVNYVLRIRGSLIYKLLDFYCLTRWCPFPILDTSVRSNVDIFTPWKVNPNAHPNANPSNRKKSKFSPICGPNFVRNFFFITFLTLDTI